jgi:hypothetical protein
MTRIATRLSIATVLLTGLVGTVAASGPTITSTVPPSAVHAPELDPGILGAGIMLVGGGLLLLNERKRKGS